MRMRILLSTLVFCLLLVLAGALMVQAQTRSFDDRNAFWESRSVIGSPDDDDSSDDEGDDEADDCPPYPAMVPKTGQTECWDQDGNLIDCAGTCQDGDYQAGVAVDPRFTDNDDGTVTDNLTGLIWLKDADCFGIQTWADALSAANALASASDSCTPDLRDGSVAGDWRLPNIGELHSLIDYSAFNYATSDPLLPPGHPFLGVEHQYAYWSSTTNEQYPLGTYIVKLDQGFAGSYNKYGPYVRMWPVRGPE